MIKKYLELLYNRMAESEDWKDSVSELKSLSGATESDIIRLKKIYPECPKLLIDLLMEINGTYWRKTDNGIIAIPILASIDNSYPNYLLSTDQIIKSVDDYFILDSVEEKYIGVYITIDDRINLKSKPQDWLHFTDCINNGGSSSLYIDFNPSANGVKGQIVEYVHDPDAFTVIANSFDDYIKNIVDSDYIFLKDWNLDE